MYTTNIKVIKSFATQHQHNKHMDSTVVKDI